jgi:hypothetical protein
MARELIYSRFRIKISVVSVGRLLKKMGMSPQKPLRKAYQQDKERVERWLKQEYPKIYHMARKDKPLSILVMKPAFALIFTAAPHGLRKARHRL